MHQPLHMQSSNHSNTSRRLVCLGVVLILSLCSGASTVSAQSQYFSGVQTTLGSGFSLPSGAAVDNSGNVYVADFMHGAVKEILAVNGTIPASPVIRTLGSGFSHPYSVALDNSGDLYVSDSGNGAVKELLAVNGSIPATPTIRTLISVALQNPPEGLAVDGKGNVYVALGGVEEGRGTPGVILELLAVNGTLPANPSEFLLDTYALYNPCGVAIDGNGNLYVADEGDNAVKEILAVNGSVSAASQITTLTTFTSAAGPVGIALDSAGDVYVADTGSNDVYRILAVNGSIPASPTVEILSTVSSFHYPTGVALDKNGNLYIADAMNNRVLEVTF